MGFLYNEYHAMYEIHNDHPKCKDCHPVNYGLSEQTPYIIIYVIRKYRRLSRLPRSPFCRHVSMTSRLNWLLCCVITQDYKESKHAVFSFGEAEVGAAQMGKNAITCLCKASWV